MSENQSQICPIRFCGSYMGFVKDNQWLKCPTCGYMTKVTKREVKPIGYDSFKRIKFK